MFTKRKIFLVDCLGLNCRLFRLFFFFFCLLARLIGSAYFFHVVPVCDDAVLDGVLEGQDSSFALRLITDVTIFLPHSHHHTLRKK